MCGSTCTCMKMISETTGMTFLGLILHLGKHLTCLVLLLASGLCHLLLLVHFEFKGQEHSAAWWSSIPHQQTDDVQVDAQARFHERI